MNHFKNHKLITRRDFLGAGLIQFTATMAAPSLISSFLARQAWAQCQGGSPGGGGPSVLPALIQLNLQGGYGALSNWAPLNQAGQPVSGCSILGIPDVVTTSNLVSYFGTQWMRSASPQTQNQDCGLVRGFNDAVNNAINSATIAGSPQAQALQNITSFARVVGLSVPGGDDTSNNPLALGNYAVSLGLLGTKISPSGITRSANFGQSYGLSNLNPDPLMLKVVQVNDLENAIGFPGPVGGLTLSQRSRLGQTIASLTQGFAPTIQAANQAAIASAAQCSNTELQAVAATTPPAVDLLDINDLVLQLIWQVNNNTGAGDQNRVFGSMVYSALAGLAGYIGLNIGGYDYHNGTRTLGEGRDQAAGFVIGKIIQSALHLGRKAVLIVTTDGATQADAQGNWTSDRGNATAQLMFFIDPAGATTIQAPSGVPATLAASIGYVNETSRTSQFSAVTSWNNERAGLAMVLNYLNFYHHNVSTSVAKLQTLMPSGFLSPQEIDLLLRVA